MMRKIWINIAMVIIQIRYECQSHLLVLIFISNKQQLPGNEIIISMLSIRDHDTISITLHAVLNCQGNNLSLPLFIKRQLIAEMSDMSNVETITG